MAERITREQRERWARVYKKGWRTVLRWREIGQRKGIPCPLDDPRQMPAWWPKCMSHTVPESVLRAAVKAADADKTQPPHDALPTSTAPFIDPATTAPIDLDKHDLNEGQALKFQRSLVAAKEKQMRDKSLAGQNIDLEQSQYVKLVKTLRELERDDREARRDTFIPRKQIEREATQAADMLRQMQPVMKRRVIELCPRLPHEFQADVLAALDHIFSAQAKIFQRLQSFADSDSMLAELAAA